MQVKFLEHLSSHPKPPKGFGLNGPLACGAPCYVLFYMPMLYILEKVAVAFNKKKKSFSHCLDQRKLISNSG